MSNIKKINLSTPGRILDAGDIRRKQNKLKKTKEQLKNLDPTSRKYHRKSFKIEKTEGQLESGRAGIGSFKMPYNAAPQQVVNSSGDERVLSQQQKDSLHGQAMKFGYPFFSSKFGVNVDPEDGVLSNRPVISEDKIYEGSGGYTLEELENLYPKSEGRKLTYKVEDKPIEEKVNEAYSKIRDQYLSMAGKKKHHMLPAKDENQMFQEFLSEYHSSKFDPETGKVMLLGNEDGGDGFISEEELAKVPSYLRNPFGR